MEGHLTSRRNRHFDRRRVIAVVLSGQGNDAATGATAVHHFGGTVIATSTETSTAPAMPEATINRDSITDHVVPLGGVAELLLAMATVPVLEPATELT
ncbi:chemotaxis protein CheB [Paractinoplanes abujensis]|uniref:protein-glutamate methylesterase n=1 Tax=Paractinoplanes abujensis TaxID=882441 RepID=A0A7W7CRL2_9ACTN|nr:chemotaxis protein CheB [Actinoplanes abujensis]MBB4693417.1 chemotaxis response regulator CheB [Actinoplanes abujensis]